MKTSVDQPQTNHVETRDVDSAIDQLLRDDVLSTLQLPMCLQLGLQMVVHDGLLAVDPVIHALQGVDLRHRRQGTKTLDARTTARSHL